MKSSVLTRLVLRTEGLRITKHCTKNFRRTSQSLLSVIGLFLIFTISVNSEAGQRILLSRKVIDTTQTPMKSFEADLVHPAAIQPEEWIVQFKVKPTESLKLMMSQAGLKLAAYLPEDAFLVRGTLQQIQKFGQRPDVKSQLQAILPFLPEYKIASSLPPLSVFDAQRSELLLIKLYAASEAAQFQKYLRVSLPDVKVLEAYKDSVLVQSRASQRMQLAQSSNVEHVQDWVDMQPLHFKLNDEGLAEVVPMAGDYTDLSGFETGTRVMNFDAAWSQGYTGKGQIASMADTGLDRGDVNTNSADFAGAIKAGYIFGLFSKSWEDPMGHGTHVAGSILGRGTASGGKLKGGAYEAQLVAEGMWSPMLNNLSVPSKLEDLFGKAYAEGARIHSNSWGAARNFGTYDNFAVAVDTFMYNNPDMLVLFAAGNSGVDKDRNGRIDPNSIGSPGTAKNVLTVGASENLLDKGGIQVVVGKLKSSPDNWPVEPIISSTMSDNINGLAMFSSRGPTVDGRLKPEIVAPGTNILSARSHVTGAEVLWGAYNDEYVFSGGTSMATPLTAGAATVLRQVLVEKLKIEAPSSALMKAAMLHSAIDMYPGQYGEIGEARGQELATHRPNMDEGFGRVDVSQYLNLSDSSTKLIDEKAGVGTGEELAYEMTSTGGPLLVNLVYTDAPASSNAAKSLVNDLDLRIVLADGQVLAPADHTNNHETIELAHAPAGSVKIFVKGYSVPQGKSGKQAFALISTVR